MPAAVPVVAAGLPPLPPPQPLPLPPPPPPPPLLVKVVVVVPWAGGRLVIARPMRSCW